MLRSLRVARSRADEDGQSVQSLRERAFPAVQTGLASSLRGPTDAPAERRIPEDEEQSRLAQSQSIDTFSH